MASLLSGSDFVYLPLWTSNKISNTVAASKGKDVPGCEGGTVTACVLCLSLCTTESLCESDGDVSL